MEGMGMPRSGSAVRAPRAAGKGRGSVVAAIAGGIAAIVMLQAARAAAGCGVDGPPTIHEEVVLVPGAERVEPWFGRTVTVAGTAVVVASPSDGDGGTANGVAHVFGDSKRGWRRVQRLQSAEPEWEDRFAQAMASDRARLVVGRDRADEGATNAGAVTVFRRSGYHFKREAEIAPPDPGAEDGFGGALGISGSMLIVGAPRDDVGDQLDAGSATIWQYRNERWELQKKLVAPEAASADWFGSAVAIDGNLAAVGAQGDDDRGEKCGAVFTYRFDGGEWLLDQKIVPEDVAAGDWFGFSVALHGNLLAVGSPRDDTGGESSGSVRIFRHGAAGWRLEATLRPEPGTTTSFFGYSVALDGTRLLVGIPGDDRNGESSGVAALFERFGGVWSQRAYLAANSPLAEESFGSAVALRGDLAVVGRLVTEDGEIAPGRAWVFRLGGTPKSTPAGPSDPSPTTAPKRTVEREE